MITLNKIISDIRNIASSGPTPDDFRITDRQIELWVHEYRSTFISQSIDKLKSISDTWIQTLKCVELQQVDKAECCDIDIDCFVLKSVQQLPDTIENKDSNLILSVTGLDDTTITPTNRFKYSYKKYSRYTGKNKGWFLKDNYLYIMNDTLLERVNVIGIFEDPSEVGKFKNCSGEPCWTIDSQYPVSMKMAKDITNTVVVEKVRPFMIFPQDSKNDSANETQLNTTK